MNKLGFLKAGEKVALDFRLEMLQLAQREPGTPSRWEAHPVAVHRGTGEEVVSERAKRLAVGGSGADGGAV